LSKTGTFSESDLTRVAYCLPLPPDNKRIAAAVAEAGMNAGETVGEMKQMMDLVNEGAKVRVLYIQVR